MARLITEWLYLDLYFTLPPGGSRGTSGEGNRDWTAIPSTASEQLSPLGWTETNAPREGDTAFTLLEVVISIALTSTLMVLVWSLFSTFTKLEERSRQSATEIQLVRSLSRQLRSDLDHFAALAIPPNVLPQALSQAVADEDSAESDSIAAKQEDSSTESEASVTATATTSDPVVESDLLDSPDLFTSRLPAQTYLRGSAKKLELVTRLPHTVDVSSDHRRLGAQTRYGTYQLVVYEYRHARDLKSLLTSDPVLNPSQFNPPAPQVSAEPNQPLAPSPVAQPLNPNDAVGLRRETKSWLQAARDRRHEELFKRAEAAGQLVDGQIPPKEEPRDLLTELRRKTDAARPSADPLDKTPHAAWTPPPEFTAKRDDLPEVIRLQFRYFDGSSWQLDWSGEDGRLPRAIEVCFDLDPDAPAVRAKEFAEAHESVLNGAKIEEVLPMDQKVEVAEFEDEQDPLSSLGLDDPTAIITEYRFVIALPGGASSSVESEEKSSEGWQEVEE